MGASLFLGFILSRNVLLIPFALVWVTRMNKHSLDNGGHSAASSPPSGAWQSCRENREGSVSLPRAQRCEEDEAGDIPLR